MDEGTYANKNRNKKALILMLSVVLVSLVAIAVVAAHRFYIRLPQSRLFYAWKKWMKCITTERLLALTGPPS